jgi:hypothetical protein
MFSCWKRRFGKIEKFNAPARPEVAVDTEDTGNAVESV